MFKNLSPKPLGITCSQSELIEMSLTHGYRGLEIDLAEFHDQSQKHGMERAARFVQSAPIRVTCAELPIDWAGDAQLYTSELSRLSQLLASAHSIGCETLYATISGSSSLPYHENFELHRQRLSEIAEALSAFEMRLGLAVDLTGAGDGHHPFIASANDLLALLKTTVANNLGVVVDTFDWTVSGGSPTMLDDLTAEQITDVRLADLPAGVDVDKVQATDRVLSGGSGAADIGGFLGKLQEMNYSGPLTPYPSPTQLSGQKREAIVKIAADAINDWLAPPEAEVTAVDTQAT